MSTPGLGLSEYRLGGFVSRGKVECKTSSPALLLKISSSSWHLCSNSELRFETFTISACSSTILRYKLRSAMVTTQKAVVRAHAIKACQTRQRCYGALTASGHGRQY